MSAVSDCARVEHHAGDAHSDASMSGFDAGRGGRVTRTDRIPASCSCSTTLSASSTLILPSTLLTFSRLFSLRALLRFLGNDSKTVSYTHLTLPTIYSV